MENSCIDRIFGSSIFWVLMGLQAAGTGGFIVLAVTMDIKYIDDDEEEDYPSSTWIAINALFGIPVACFCFLFAGAAFFNAFHKATSSSSSSSSSKKSFTSLLPNLKNKKIASPTLPVFMSQDVQSMV